MQSVHAGRIVFFLGDVAKALRTARARRRLGCELIDAGRPVFVALGAALVLAGLIQTTWLLYAAISIAFWARSA